MTPFDAAIVALAAFRLTRLVTSDTLTADQRNAVVRWALRVPEPNPRRKIADLVECNYCAGWWVTLLVLAGYRLRLTRPLVAAFAAAGAQALLSAADVALNDA